MVPSELMPQNHVAAMLAKRVQLRGCTQDLWRDQLGQQRSAFQHAAQPPAGATLPQSPGPDNVNALLSMPEALRSQANDQLPCYVLRAGQPEAAGPAGRLHESAPAMQSDAELVNLIKGFLQDPEFQEEVERVAMLWDRAEQELLAEQV